MRTRLREFVVRHEMSWHIFTVSVYAAAILAVVLVFPDVSNLWVSLFVLVGTFTASITAMIGVIKTRADERG